MEDNKPVDEMPEESNTTPASNEAPTQKASPLPIIIGGVGALVLIIVGLFLPPISLGDRLGLTGGDEEAAVVEEEATTTETTSGAEIPGEITVSGA
ncbi:MAG: hypothetical protein KDE51_20985, partial [Anaerolineales bacterium]|nr:hypothetical protein [Anaerolineales bacterium]